MDILTTSILSSLAWSISSTLLQLSVYSTVKASAASNNQLQQSTSTKSEYFGLRRTDWWPSQSSPSPVTSYSNTKHICVQQTDPHRRQTAPQDKIMSTSWVSTPRPTPVATLLCACEWDKHRTVMSAYQHNHVVGSVVMLNVTHISWLDMSALHWGIWLLLRAILTVEFVVLFDPLRSSGKHRYPFYDAFQICYKLQYSLSTQYPKPF